MAFARLGIVELAGKRGSAATAQAVAHDHNLADFELRDGELKRRRNAVIAAVRLIGRRQSGDVADDEHLAGPGVEDVRGIDPAVGAGQDHDLRALPFGELRPALAFALPVVARETGDSLRSDR